MAGQSHCNHSKDALVVTQLGIVRVLGCTPLPIPLGTIPQDPFQYRITSFHWENLSSTYEVLFCATMMLSKLSP
jgi:hypothetical protein